jgi:hypothetical protein
MKQLPSTFNGLYDSLYQFWYTDTPNECDSVPCGGCLIEPECGIAGHLLKLLKEKKELVDGLLS